MVTASLARVPTRSFRAENGDALHDLRNASLPDPGTAAPVRFLAVWDAMMLVHARRSQDLERSSDK